jgi:hypothetical protein
MKPTLHISLISHPVLLLPIVTKHSAALGIVIQSSLMFYLFGLCYPLLYLDAGNLYLHVLSIELVYHLIISRYISNLDLDVMLFDYLDTNDVLDIMILFILMVVMIFGNASDVMILVDVNVVSNISLLMLTGYKWIHN